VVALILQFEACTGSGAAPRRDSFRCTAGVSAGAAGDVVVALALRIETGARCGCQNNGGQDNGAGRSTSPAACRQSAARRKSGASGKPSTSLNRVCRQSACCRIASRAYWKSACRDTGACAGIFSAGDESRARSCASSTGGKARGKGIGYSALKHDPEKPVLGLDPRMDFRFSEKIMLQRHQRSGG
jgi:hypothetical protein